MKNFINFSNGNQNTRMPAYQVTVLYAGSSLSFSLSNGETFEELADLLDTLGERHIGEPTAIYLKPGLADKPICIIQPGFCPDKDISIAS
ncbi:MAG TPA: hypothetical protein VFW37_09330 [Alphaproteobacteria bacterium]|nr:hypothetical protein [Alphaproteobacteria bacterium]